MLRELLYPWHPWFELQVAIHEALEKPDGLVFRCTVSGSDADRWLEVPAWMFERAAWPDHVQLTATPFIDTTTLSVLADLVRQVLKDWAASSNAPLSGASKSSHDQNRREAHVSINISAAVSQHERNTEDHGQELESHNRSRSTYSGTNGRTPWWLDRRGKNCRWRRSPQ